MEQRPAQSAERDDSAGANSTGAEDGPARSTGAAKSPAQSAQAPSESTSEPEKQPPFKYVHSGNLPDLLGHLGVTVVATTFQAGRVLSFAGVNGRCSLLVRAFPHPMGLALDGRNMALVCSNQIWFMVNQTDLVDQEGKRPPYDAYYIPRRAHVTGDIAGHEAAWGIRASEHGLPARPDHSLGQEAHAPVDHSHGLEAHAPDPNPELWVVNTRFSCLCTLDPDYSFVPRWRPPFVSELAAEDRCHLNGMAMVDGRPTYVTCLARTDVPQGWRDHKTDGGSILDVESGEVVTTGLAMPHSPRWYSGTLYVLDSGRAELQTVDLASGKRETICRLPGYVRGLAFHDRFAFIGLSKAREQRTFGGLPIELILPEIECGIQVVDLESGQVVSFIRFDAGCDELFDVQIAPNVSRLNVIGFSKETINGIFVLPKK